METETIESKVASLIEKGVIDVGYWYRTDDISKSLCIDTVEELHAYLVKHDRFDTDKIGETYYFMSK